MRILFAVLLSWLSMTAGAQERLLIPITGTQTPGAYGSVWTTELWAHNQSDDVIYLSPTSYCPGLPICVPRTPIEPGGAIRIYLPGVPEGFPPGRILTATPAVGTTLAVDALFMNLRVRDESRAAASMGIEIPIVPVSDLFTTPLSLLNIPGDELFRHTLRIYDIDNQPSAFRVRLFDSDTGEELPSQSVVLTVNEYDFVEPEPLSHAPSAAQIDLRPNIPIGDKRYHLTIEPLQPSTYWAFISITNNETQEVTLTTPR